MRLVNTLKPLALVLTAGLMLSAFATPALAQGGGRGPGGGGGGGMFGGMGGMGNTSAPVAKADIEKMAKLLKLTPDQVAAANALLDGQMAQYTKKADEFRKAQEAAREEFRESRDFSVFTSLQPKVDEFRKYREQTEKQFFTDVKGVLDKKQVEEFPAFERAHRREQSMSRGLMSGERADVIAIVERMKLPADKQKAVDPILDQYSVELDKAIEARNAQQDKIAASGVFRNMFSPDGGADPDAVKKADAMIKEGREAAAALRDVNRKYAKQVESTLGGAEGEKFAAEFRKSSFPDVYRERYIDRAINAAAGMTDLKPEQAEGIKALREQYARSSRPIDEAGEKVVEEREANFSISNMRQRFGGGGGGQDDEKAQEQRRQRRELEDSTLEKLKSILTPEQAAKLPERNQGGPGGGQGGDGAPRRQRGGQGGNNDGNNSGGNAPRRQRGGGNAPADTAPPAPRN